MKDDNIPSLGQRGEAVAFKAAFFLLPNWKIIKLEGFFQERYMYVFLLLEAGTELVEVCNYCFITILFSE